MAWDIGQYGGAVNVARGGEGMERGGQGVSFGHLAEDDSTMVGGERKKRNKWG